MSNRNKDVDLWRFIAILIIMAHHLYILGIKEYPFYDGWIYVEFFLIITGYYTLSHFEGKRKENKAKEAVEYTIKKFLPLLPYTVAVTLAAWLTQNISALINGGGVKQFLTSFLGDFAFDLLWLSTFPLVAPLWYLSAMIIVFPFFCWFIQRENRYMTLLVCFSYVIIFYGSEGVTTARSFLFDIFRVLAGLMLGALIYEINYVFGELLMKINSSICTSIEILLLLFPIVSVYRNWETYKLDLLCFAVGLGLMFSGRCFSVASKIKVFNYLGKISMPMFILHWYIGTVVNHINSIMQWNILMKVTLYYLGTFIVSMLAMFFVEHWKWFQSILSKGVKLIE